MRKEREVILNNPVQYLIIGDLDKPFDRPECECERCEKWRTKKGRPTHAELRAIDAAEPLVGASDDTGTADAGTGDTGEDDAGGVGS